MKGIFKNSTEVSTGTLLDFLKEGGRSCRVCAGLADQNQIADVLQEMFHSDNNLK